MTRRIAPEAPIALEFHGLPFHDPFHGQAFDRRWLPAAPVPDVLSACDALRDEIWRAVVRADEETMLRSANGPAVERSCQGHPVARRRLRRRLGGWSISP